MTQPSLFDVRTGKVRRDEGARRVTDNEPDPSPVDEAIADLASSGRTFTADDLPDRVRRRVHHPNVVSAAFLRAKRAGLIVEVGWTRSERPSAHARRLVEYRGAS